MQSTWYVGICVNNISASPALTLLSFLIAISKYIKCEVIDTSIPHPPESEEYLKAYVKKSALTVYHPIGTCKMGSASDPTAVVDPTLKVKGIKGLRVADASIMPNIVSANTNAPAIMIGEKAADLIKADWK